MLIDILKKVPYDPTSAPNVTLLGIEKEKGDAAAAALTGSRKGEELITERIMPNLEKLGQDDDVDVRYFAMTASHVWTGGDVMES